MRYLTTALALSLVATAGSAAPRLPDRISGQRFGPWGTRITQWQVDANGAVRWSRSRGKGALGTTTFTRRGALAELQAVLAPVEREAALASDCPPPPTDQGFAHVEWRYAPRTVRYHLDDDCATARAVAAGKVIAAAEATLDGWSRAARGGGRAK